MRNNRKLIAIAACAATLAVGGSAYTGSLDATADSEDTVGAGAVAVSGATVNTVSYTNDTTDITGVTVVFAGQYAAASTTVQVDVGATTFSCGEETVNEIDDTTTVSCTGTVAISSATSTQIALSSDTVDPVV